MPLHGTAALSNVRAGFYGGWLKDVPTRFIHRSSLERVPEFVVKSITENYYCFYRRPVDDDGSVENSRIGSSILLKYNRLIALDYETWDSKLFRMFFFTGQNVLKMYLRPRSAATRSSTVRQCRDGSIRIFRSETRLNAQLPFIHVHQWRIWWGV